MDYTTSQNKKTISHEMYTKIFRDYDLPYRERPSFSLKKEPLDYLSKSNVESMIDINQIDSIICCYETYQMSDITKISPAPLRIKEEIGANSLAFSIGDKGALSPLHALEWAQLVGKSVLLICLEHQIIEPKQFSNGLFPKRDACALSCFNYEQGDFEVLYYDYKSVYHDKNRDIEKVLAKELSTLVEYSLQLIGLNLQEVCIIPQMVGSEFLTQMHKRFKNVIYKDGKVNLSTADSLYSLTEGILNNQCQFPYITLCFADTRGVGFILLSNAKYQAL